ncbi:hypothetical protein [Mycolicibacterium brumae]|uniref:ESX-1 secretion-associated protein n=1 Tax=Mycolicibacterium brumae TaxID=85968 RepID=A0A2G5PB21_9MYCO|nr:hypothetical protein [Mycolicibacterium brumae]MCV7193291.1 hypothetical protein [Mycolicibacterium brumae]PIB75569.1 hypothetical protein CQY22_009125 [Mycolicibacterium brumae]RWA21064.1 hypothetical protein MBRU_15260 [Mycolicibacterium brumae DSM 44177]UWW09948.1 hypothetical protein L2Z93_003066 [Mycolicibacterium brumae]
MRLAQWRENAGRRGVGPPALAAIADRCRITADSFAVLDALTEITDPAGKSFFAIPAGSSAGDIAAAVLMTYVLNAGTGYRAAGAPGDFAETPYSVAEVRRIAARQRRNRWSYPRAALAVNRGGALATTPNGMLMGVGGPVLSAVSFRGGTTWGDVFAVNVAAAGDPVEALRANIGCGRACFARDDGVLRAGSLSLDRLLHHEERHAQQWAVRGAARMVADYAAGQLYAATTGRPHPMEVDAGLSDGGYR